MYVNSVTDIGFDLVVLDVLYALLTLLTLWHVALYTKWEGFRVVVSIFCMALMTEQLSIQFGNTHCHNDALVMFSKCSSLNSVLTYVPWMYTCYMGSARWLRTPSSPLTQAITMGVLQPLFLIPYELSGAHFVWWRWPKNDIAALHTKLWGIPIMALYFHSVFGLCLTLWRNWSFRIARNTLGMRPNSAGDNVTQIVTTVLGAPTIALLFDIPTFVMEYFFGVSRIATVGLFFGGCVCIVISALFKSPASRSSNGPLQEILLPHVDALLFLIVVWFSTIIFLLDLNRLLSIAYSRTTNLTNNKIELVVNSVVDLLMNESSVCLVVFIDILLSLTTFYMIFMRPFAKVYSKDK